MDPDPDPVAYRFGRRGVLVAADDLWPGLADRPALLARLVEAGVLVAIWEAAGPAGGHGGPPPSLAGRAS